PASHVEPTLGYARSGVSTRTLDSSSGRWTGGEQFTPTATTRGDEAASAAASANVDPPLMCEPSEQLKLIHAETPGSPSRIVTSASVSRIDGIVSIASRSGAASRSTS